MKSKQQTTNNKQQTTNNKQQTTNNKQQTKPKTDPQMDTQSRGESLTAAGAITLTMFTEIEQQRGVATVVEDGQMAQPRAAIYIERGGCMCMCMCMCVFGEFGRV
jgi:hypothetical protein